ncbi:MAG: class 3 adenylate cyclase/tetratricopeptide (TPR) repeat protein [Candidatus Azotimanducaceae bacterium]|jgi:class 3 adenylate cyclase/tetratricopeptide (TPR) repeat protein
MPTSPNEQLQTNTDERRKITVVLCDLVASTELQTIVGMERFYLIQKAFLKRALEVSNEFDAEQIRFTGDGLAFALGRTHANEHQVQRGARLGLALVRAINDLNPQGQHLDLRVALVSGEAIVSTADDAAPFEDGNISVSGPVMPTAARIIGVANANQVVADQQSARLLRSEFTLSRLGTFEFKGLQSKRNVWLLGELQLSDNGVKGKSKLVAPIERANEQPMFRKCWGDVQTGTPKAIWVEGEAGVGKSHLASFLSSNISDNQKVTISSHPHHHGQTEQRSEALAPLLDWLNGLFHNTQNLSFEDFRNVCVSRLPHLSSMPEENLNSLRQLADGTEGLEKIASPDVVKERRTNLFANLFIAMGNTDPCLVILEDAHWMDDSTAAVFARALEVNNSQLLLLITARPRGSSELPDNIQRLVSAADFWPLRALSKKGAAEFASTCLGNVEVSQEKLEELISRSDGIPLYIERLCMEAVNNASSTPATAKQYQENNDARVPGVLFEVLMSTLDRLPGARAFTQLASIQGREFDLSYVPLLTEYSAENLLQLVELLVDNKILEVMDGLDHFRFRHHLIRDVAYSSLMSHERGHYHGQLAKILLEDFQDQAIPPHAIIAAHFEKAARLSLDGSEVRAHTIAAAEGWLRAARQSVSRSEITESLTRIHQAESLLDGLNLSNDAPVHGLKMAACAERAYVHSLYSGWGTDEVGRAIEDGESIRRLSPDLIRDTTWQDLQQVVGGYYITIGDLEKAGQHGEELKDIAASLSKEFEGRVDIAGIELAASRSLGGYLCLTGKHAQAIEVIDKGLADYVLTDSAIRQVERHNITNHRATLQVYRAISQLSRGNFIDALTSIEDAISYAQEIDHGHSATHALVFRTAILIMLRDNRMDDAAEAAAEFAEQNNYSTWIAPARMMLGHCHAMRQDLYQGIVAIDTAAEGNPNIYAPFGISLIVSAELARGNQPQICVPLLKAAQAIMDQTHEYWFLPETLRLQGMVEAEIARENNDDPLNAAELSLRSAHEVATEQGAHFWSLRAAHSLADLLVTAGRAQEARQLIRSELVHFDTSQRFADLEDALRIGSL